MHSARSDFIAMAESHAIKMPLDHLHHGLREAFSVICPSGKQKRRFCHIMLCLMFKPVPWKFAERLGCGYCSVAGRLNSKLLRSSPFSISGRKQVHGLGESGEIRNGTRRRTKGRCVNLSCSWNLSPLSLLLETFYSRRLLRWDNL